MGRRSRHALLACLAVSTSCGQANKTDADPGAIAVQGRNVTLYYHSTAVPCAGTLAYLDANVDAIASYLGLTPVAPIPYHYTQALPCPPDANGCTIGAQGEHAVVWATTPYSVHELVHAVQLPNRLSASFLMEGQAVSLGEGTTIIDAPTGISDEDLLTPTPLPGDDYPIAGDLASYLFTKFGPSSFERAIGIASWGASPDDVEAAFVQVYGESMDQLRTDRAASGLRFPDNRIGLTECMALPTDDGLGAGAAVTESLDCSTNGLGTVGVNEFRVVPFDIAEDGIYSLEVTVPSAAGASVFLSGCGRTSWISWGASATVPSSSLVVGYLPKGRYSFQLDAAPDADASFGLTVHPIVVASNPGCRTIPPIEVPAGTANLFVLSMLDGPLEVPFVAGEAKTLVGQIGLASQMQVCLGGCDQSCVNPLPPTQPTVAAGMLFTVQAQIVTPAGVGAGGFVAVELE